MLRLAAVLFALAGAARAAVDVHEVIRVFHKCQSDVAARWRYDPALVCAAATVYGPQQKRALGSEVSNLFMRSASIDPLMPEVAAGVPIYDGIQVYLSERFRFIYIRQPKSSSSSILATIQELFCEGRVCMSHEFKLANNGVVPDQVWRDYYVFTAVRNPIARMLSTFNMFKRYLRHRPLGATAPGEHCHQQIPFADFAHSVIKMRTACDTIQCCAFVPEGQNKFIENLPNPHISQQAHAVFTLDGRSLVDFIARSENMAEDWEQLVKLIAQHNGKDIGFRPLVHINTFTSTAFMLPAGEFNAGKAYTSEAPHPCLQNDVANMGYLNETTVFGLAKQFAMDMELLGFSRP